MKKLISVVVPAFNEEAVLEEFHRRMSGIFDRLPEYRCEMVFVNDGSSDRTRAIIDQLAETDARVSAISLTRNFGKEAAMTAGLDLADADAVAIFDVDLQDPPELLIEFVAKWREGFDIVYARRTKREGESWLKKMTAAAFYRVMRRLSRVEIPQDIGDCRLMSRRAIASLRQLREQHRFMKGLFAWIGYPSVAVDYCRDPRAAGATKFNYWKLWNFALEGITSFTVAPLKLALYIGMLIAIGAFAMAVWIILKTMLWGEVVRGYPTLIVTVLFLGGVQLFCIGILGEYIGRIFGESKRRPIYLIDLHQRSRISQDSEPSDHRR